MSTGAMPELPAVSVVVVAIALAPRVWLKDADAGGKTCAAAKAATGTHKSVDFLAF
ncbi:hypothetical protein [Pseudacidovorax sp. 1753]|uniref:hypothetical protein n=1 Tax=Pseudacidovorax sp. 1753 TaxID=3156419 RepID=UPI0033999370